jgi:hypothetical protein
MNDIIYVIMIDDDDDGLSRDDDPNGNHTWTGMTRLCMTKLNVVVPIPLYGPVNTALEGRGKMK